MGALPELSDGVVVLRPLGPSDAAEHLAGEDEELWRWLSGRPATLETVEVWIARNLAFWRAEGAVRNFGVWDAASGALAGNVEANLAARELPPGEANISYAVWPAFRGRRYAVRAVALLVGYLATETKAHRAVIRVDPENVASLRVARAVGFTEVGPVPEGTKALIRFEHTFDRPRRSRSRRAKRAKAE